MVTPMFTADNAILPSIPCLYGRWCGPGCSGPGEPRDGTDECCMMHDRCYEKYGYFSCKCDKELLSCLAPKRNALTKGGRAAIIVYNWFKVQPCKNTSEQQASTQGGTSMNW